MRPLRPIALWICFTLVLLGCGKSEPRRELTKADFDRIQVGMPVEEVKASFRNRTVDQNQSMKVVNQKNRGTIGYSVDGRNITIEFEDGKATEKSQTGLE